jgi:hypothetical protein
MSSRTTPNTARNLLRDGLKDDAELAKDISAFFAFAATTAAGNPLSLVAALGLILQTSGSIISAALNLAGRFRGEDGRPADTLPPYQRFNALFLLATVRAYMEAVGAVLEVEITQIQEAEKKAKKGRSGRAKGPEDDGHDEIAGDERRRALEEARERAQEVNDADLTYLFGVEPLTDEVPLLAALGEWLVASLVLAGLSGLEAKAIAEKCDTEARSRFRVAIAEDTSEAGWMRNFLALEAQASTTGSVEDLKATADALNGWLSDQRAPSTSNAAWADYREVLNGLPNQKKTMYSESFGVSHVFQAPLVKYHVAGVRGEAGVPHEITDVGRLLGALVSTRTEGQDLIVLSGGPGSGKSTLCRMFASELAQSPEAHPIFLQLRRVKEGAEITQFIEDALQRRGLIDRISELLGLPNVVLILDGFDELVAANRSRLRQFFNALLDETQTGPLRKAHVIVSGRDTLFPGGQGLPAGSHVVELQPFDRARVEGWGRCWRSQHASGPGSTFKPELLLGDSEESNSPLEHLVTWPLTLHLVARVHTSGGLPSPDAGIRIDKAYLYRSILAETSERQADQVSGQGRLEPEAMRSFLRSVAWLMYTRSVDSLDVSDVTPLIDSLKATHDELDSSQLAEVAVLNAPELSKGEETGFEFVHKSFSEFLAAESIAERVERASFLVEEFGSDTPAWRMSSTEASSALAEVLAIRLLPEEIQEMLEPMLGAVLKFREGNGVEDRVPPEDRYEGLNAVLRRCEELYATALSCTDGFGSLEDVVKEAPGVANTLEGFANYLVGLALIGCAAAEQVESEGSDCRFKAEPEPGAIWRFLALAQAGGISLDDRLGSRLFSRMSARRGGDEELTDISVPWKLHVLDGMDGYRSEISRVAERALEANRLATQLVMLLALVLRGDKLGNPFQATKRISSRQRQYLWDQLRHERYGADAAEELTFLLGRLGAVSPRTADSWLRRSRYLDRDWAEAFRHSMSASFDPDISKVEPRRILGHMLAEMPRRGSEARLVRLVEEILMEFEERLR